MATKKPIKNLFRKSLTLVFIAVLIALLVFSQLSILQFGFVPNVKASGDVYDYVDQLSNVDGVTDVGTHSGFVAMQTGPDSTFDTLTEADTGGAPLTITFVNVGAEATGTGAVTPALPASMVSGDICILVATTIAGGTVTITATGSITTWTVLTGSPIDVTLGEKLYVWWGRWTSGTTGPTVTPGSDHVEAGIGAWRNCLSSGSPIDVSQTGTETTSDTSFNFATSISTTVNGAMCIAICTTGTDIATNGQFAVMTDSSLTSLAERMDYETSSGGGGGFALDEGYKATAGAVGTWLSTLTTASTKAYISFALKPALSPNYQLDLEVQWTTAEFSQTHEELCIDTGTMDTENLEVDVRDGTSWTPIIAALSASQWNNVSVSAYLTSATFTIRFKGTVETADTSQSAWQIDCVQLHTWEETPPSLPGSTLFSDGFESGSFSAWTGTSGTPTVQSGIVHHGNYASQSLAADANDYCYKTGMAGASLIYSRAYFYFDAFPTSGNFISIMSSVVSSVRAVVYNDAGTIKWGMFLGGVPTYFATPNPIINTWYCVELLISNTQPCQLWIDDISVGTVGACGNQATDLYIGGWDKTSAINVYFDCAVVSNNYIGPEVFYYHLSGSWTTISGNPNDTHAFQPVHTTGIVEVNKVVDGASRKYLAYDSQSGAGNFDIRLYYTDDLDGAWTPYSGNPILTSTTHRWPSTAYVGGVFHMFLTDWDAWTLERWTSTDGINFAFQENIISGGQVTRNPFIWLNPNDNKWYLYQRDYVGATAYINARNATNIADLDSAADTIILQSDAIALGSPSIMYRDGRYWLLIETIPGALWEVLAYYSSLPTSGFVQCGNSPILTNDEACGIHLLSPDGTKAYLFSNRDSANWYQDTREVYIAYDYVDRTSNADGVADAGAHSSFTAQMYGPDGTYDTLTEADGGDGSTSNVFTDGFEDGTFTKWTDGGTTTWGDGGTFMATNSSPGNPWLTHSGTYMADCDSNDDGSLTSDNINMTGAGAIGVSCWRMDDDMDGDDFYFYAYDGTTYDQIAALSASGTGNEDVMRYYSWTTTDSQYFISNFRIRFGATPSSTEAAFIDDVVVNKTLPNYKLDLEAQWFDANYTRANEELCIYVGSVNAENLRVDVWNGAGWTTVIATLSANQWNNVSVSTYLTSSTFTIRYKGTSETSDTVQSTWQIDCALLHTWTIVSQTFTHNYWTTSTGATTETWNVIVVDVDPTTTTSQTSVVLTSIVSTSTSTTATETSIISTTGTTTATSCTTLSTTSTQSTSTTTTVTSTSTETSWTTTTLPTTSISTSLTTTTLPTTSTATSLTCTTLQTTSTSTSWSTVTLPTTSTSTSLTTTTTETTSTSVSTSLTTTTLPTTETSTSLTTTTLPTTSTSTSLTTTTTETSLTSISTSMTCTTLPTTSTSTSLTCTTLGTTTTSTETSLTCTTLPTTSTSTSLTTTTTETTSTSVSTSLTTTTFPTTSTSTSLTTTTLPTTSTSTSLMTTTTETTTTSVSTSMTTTTLPQTSVSTSLTTTTLQTTSISTSLTITTLPTTTTETSLTCTTLQSTSTSTSWSTTTLPTTSTETSLTCTTLQTTFTSISQTTTTTETTSVSTSLTCTTLPTTSISTSLTTTTLQTTSVSTSLTCTTFPTTSTETSLTCTTLEITSTSVSSTVTTTQTTSTETSETTTTTQTISTSTSMTCTTLPTTSISTSLTCTTLGTTSTSTSTSLTCTTLPTTSTLTSLTCTTLETTMISTSLTCTTLETTSVSTSWTTTTFPTTSTETSLTCTTLPTTSTSVSSTTTTTQTTSISTSLTCTTLPTTLTSTSLTTTTLQTTSVSTSSTCTTFPTTSTETSLTCTTLEITSTSVSATTTTTETTSTSLTCTTLPVTSVSTSLTCTTFETTSISTSETTTTLESTTSSITTTTFSTTSISTSLTCTTFQFTQTNMSLTTTMTTFTQSHMTVTTLTIMSTITSASSTTVTFALTTQTMTFTTTIRSPGVGINFFAVRVIDWQGSPIYNIAVFIRSYGLNQTSNLFTDEDGYAKFQVPNDLYDVWAVTGRTLHTTGYNPGNLIVMQYTWYLLIEDFLVWAPLLIPNWLIILIAAIIIGYALYLFFKSA